MKDSISFVNGLTNQGTLIESNKIVIIAIVVAVTAIASLVYYARQKKTRQLKKVILEETANVDFTNMTHDWEKTKKLYDTLKKKCHPDKFGDDLNKEATRIFQLIVENKYGSSDISSDIVIGKEGNRCFLYICSDQAINTKDEQQFPISRLGSLFP